MLTEVDLANATDRLLEEAVAAYRAGKLNDVEPPCQRILELQPHHFASLQLLAAVAANKGEPRRGIELIERAISLRPEAADGYIELAKLLRLDDRTSGAIAALQKAIECEPGSAAAHNDLGLIHLAQDDLVEALACFDRAIEIRPAHPLTANMSRSRATRSGNSVVCLHQGAPFPSRGCKRRAPRLDELPRAGARMCERRWECRLRGRPDHPRRQFWGQPKRFDSGAANGY
jgi:tetratricopeptide (TPR) repeat protein